MVERDVCLPTWFESIRWITLSIFNDQPVQVIPRPMDMGMKDKVGSSPAAKLLVVLVQIMVVRKIIMVRVVALVPFDLVLEPVQSPLGLTLVTPPHINKNVNHQTLHQALEDQLPLYANGFFFLGFSIVIAYGCCESSYCGCDA